MLASLPFTLSSIVCIGCGAGITVAKQEHMLGSFGPKAEEQMAKTPIEDTPSGMLGRYGALSLSLALSLFLATRLGCSDGTVRSRSALFPWQPTS
jgi:hypothetical protein